jgi:hypothetical protein
MIHVVTDSKEIDNHHKNFHSKLDSHFTEKITCRVGYPGGSFEDTVRYSPDLGIWISAQKLDSRFWNGFGFGKPLEKQNNPLVGEINFPYGKIDRRIAGAFAKDGNGNALVLHRGKIGGGKRGIGKTYFIDNFRGDFITAIDGDRESEFCLVGELNSTYFPKQVADFISEIYRVKYLVAKEPGSADFNELLDFHYTDEHSGVTTTERNDPVEIKRTHGLVVNALAKELRKREFNIANDKNRDLFIHENNRITTLFEIKTSSSTQDLYSAIGQLLLYSIPMPESVRLIAVLPNKLSARVAEKFASLKIKLLYYRWINDKPEFLNLNTFF